MTMVSVTFADVVVVGAGAAGLMCAIEAGKRGRSVIVLEHNDHIGKKIRISGGGRCNFTNLHLGAEHYVSQNPHFARSALTRYRPEDFCALVREYQIPFHEKTLGQLFCDESSQNIIVLLKKECDRHHVRLMLGVKVLKVDKTGAFCVETTQGVFKSQSLVIATGGLSIPSLGATDFGYQVARHFGITVTDRFPGLVPLTLAEQELKVLGTLSGISLEAVVRFEKVQFREKILFTHRGLSGPAILQISSYWKPGQPIAINLIPDQNMFDILKAQHKSKTVLKNFLKAFLPARLTEVLCAYFLESKALDQYSEEGFRAIADFLHNWRLVPQGTEGYAKAEVTVGGVDTHELSSKTMETKKIPGLYFIGEVVDVTGHLGGFNFQWAWSSGYAAGQCV